MYLDFKRKYQDFQSTSANWSTSKTSMIKMCLCWYKSETKDFQLVLLAFIFCLFSFEITYLEILIVLKLTCQDLDPYAICQKGWLIQMYSWKVWLRGTKKKKWEVGWCALGSCETLKLWEVKPCCAAVGPLEHIPRTECIHFLSLCSRRWQCSKELKACVKWCLPCHWLSPDDNRRHQGC